MFTVSIAQENRPENPDNIQSKFFMYLGVYVGRYLGKYIKVLIMYTSNSNLFMPMRLKILCLLA